jgi:pimeloyl-ACP methyl ester carboxylesterase
MAARAFAKRGYRVLAFDFAGFGDSQHGSGPDARVDTDVVAAAEQLRRRGADRIVLVGSAPAAVATRYDCGWPSAMRPRSTAPRSTNGWDAWCTAQPLAHRDVTVHHHGHEPGRS